MFYKTTMGTIRKIITTVPANANFERTAWLLRDVVVVFLEAVASGLSEQMNLLSDLYS